MTERFFHVGYEIRDDGVNGCRIFLSINDYVKDVLVEQGARKIVSKRVWIELIHVDGLVERLLKVYRHRSVVFCFADL